MSNHKEIIAVNDYHNATKHHIDRPAKSLGYMDWENQPNPFRFYSDIEVLPLPFINDDNPLPHRFLFEVAGIPIQPYCLKTIAAIAELSLALSAWKEVSGSRWSLRINPSSGNLHPTESYWLLPETESIKNGLYHYNPFYHGFYQRAVYSETFPELITKHFKSEGFFVVLSSIYLRESWKYGERAFRYCNHDIGHALAALRFSANLQGWQVSSLTDIADKHLVSILGFDRSNLPPEEKEVPDVICWVHPRENENPKTKLSSELLELLSKSDIMGKMESLTQKSHPWPIIDEISHVCKKKETTSKKIASPNFDSFELPASNLSAEQIIRKRRSGVSFHPQKSEISKSHFLGILDATLPRAEYAPFDLNLGSPEIHLFIFVHNVTDLEAGFYVLVRDPIRIKELKQHTNQAFNWNRIDKKLPLYHLCSGDFRDTAAGLSCRQDIAGESAFSLGMVAHFSENIQSNAYLYKHLFWESGIIGQVIYLQSEAYGYRSTGIGCYFDDVMHDVCGFKDDHFQSLYHFTVGYPIDDSRISTKKAYFHLEESVEK